MALFYFVAIVLSLSCTHVLGIAKPKANTVPTENDLFWGLDKPQEEYKLPKFHYSFDAMEPYIDRETMEVHYNAIFKSYVVKLNEVLKEWRNSKGNATDPKHAKSVALAKGSLIDMWRGLPDIPEEFRKKFVYNAGGYFNHLLYFSTMAPNKETKERMPSQEFVELVELSFHNMTLMKQDINETAEMLFGTGWVYLVRATGYADGGEYLTVMSTLEEMTPMDNKRVFPILALDLWEHAYFRKYQVNRSKYIKNWWNLVDWESVERLLNWWKILVPEVKQAPKHTDL